MNESGKLIYCSFCGRSQFECGRMIAGDSANICDICLDLANMIPERLEVKEAEWERLKGFAP